MKREEKVAIEFGFVLVQEIPPLRLHYAEMKGSGAEAQLMIFLHGFGEFWYAWSEYLPYFAQLGFHVVAPDLRGYNLSDRPLSKNEYKIEALVSDIVHLIRCFGKRKAIVIGHDWGGAITWELADAFPEVCERIVVMNCPHRGAFAKNIRRNFLLGVKQSLRSWYLYYFLLPWLPEWSLRLLDYQWIRYNFAGGADNKQAFSDERLEKYLRALQVPGALEAGLNYYRANTTGNYGMGVIKAVLGLDSFDPITVPTLLIWGEEDFALEKGLTHNIEDFFLAGIRVKYIPGCSHWVHLEKPELVMEYITRFVL